MFDWKNNFFQKIIDFFWETASIFLQDTKEKSSLEPLFINATASYQKEIPGCQVDGVEYIFPYTPVIQKKIHKIKYYKGKQGIAEFIPHLTKLVSKMISGESGQVIVMGVPMFFIHTILRWYNQSYLLAQWLAKEMNLPYAPIMKKVRWTKHQARLKKEKRYKNLDNAFQIRKKYKNKIKGATILVIDDIISTGTTIQKIAEELKKDWANEN